MKGEAKPWEETWEAEPDGSDIKVWVHTDELFHDCFIGAPGMDRAKLAAQAPAMARLLRSVCNEIDLDNGGAEIRAEILTVLKLAGVPP